MTTNATIIDDALREIGVIEEGENASADQYSISLRRLNQLLESWKVRKIDLGYFPQTDETDTIPIPLWAELAVTMLLATRLAGDFMAPISAKLAGDAEEGWNFLLRTYMNLNLPKADMSHLPQGMGSNWNIENDQFV